jgi:hypothetical protein
VEGGPVRSRLSIRRGLTPSQSQCQRHPVKSMLHIVHGARCQRSPVAAKSLYVIVQRRDPVPREESYGGALGNASWGGVGV